MDISLRTKQLNSLFSYDKKTELAESHLEIIPVPDRFPYEPYPGIMGQSPCDPPLGKQTQGGGSERDELHLRQRSPQQPAIPKPVTLLRLGQRVRL